MSATPDQPRQEIFRIGAGAAYANDRIEPAQLLVETCELDCIVLECLAERTLALDQAARRIDPGKGYNRRLERRMRALLPACRAQGTRIVTNMGSANPRAAGEETIRIARALGLESLSVAVVTGDDVLHLLDQDTELTDLGRSIADFGRAPISANAYIGIDALLPGIAADVLIAGRAADSSLFLAPIAHHFGWRLDEWDRIARGVVVGHLLECTAHVTGGYFADPGYKDVPGMDDIGYPFAEVDAEGNCVISKPPGSGGLVTEHIVKEQLLYEIHDPRAYRTPDIVANFATVRLGSPGKDRVAVRGATGTARPSDLKVTVGFDGGFLAEGEVSYAGPGALDRARLAAEIIDRRVRRFWPEDIPFRLDLIGVSAVHAAAGATAEASNDVRLRGAARVADRTLAERLLEEIECIVINGPAGGGGHRERLVPSIITHSAMIARDAVKTECEVLTI
jgi:hypothetical protein